MSKFLEHLKSKNLTAREVSVCERVCLGESNQEVATALQLELRTIKFNMTDILKKTGMKSRAKLIVHCFNNGFMEHKNAGKIP